MIFLQLLLLIKYCQFYRLQLEIINLATSFNMLLLSSRCMQCCSI